MADVITRFKLETTQFDSKLRDAAKNIRTISNEAKATGKSFDMFSKESVDAARALGSVASGAKDTKNKVRDLVGAYNEAARAYNQLSEQQKNTDFGKNLANSIGQLKVRISDAKQELYGMNDALKGAGGNNVNFNSLLEELGGRLGVSSNLMGVLTKGTIGYTAAIGAAAAAVSAAAKEWANYNTELGKQSQITTVTTGLSGSDADKMTTAARSISSVYGTDYREVINAANTLMTQFGENGDSAIQLIRDGMQGMIQGDGPKLLSMIQQFAPSFRDAGISADQLVAIIHNSEGGIFTDQNMNAIVMGIKNIRLMTNATSEALAQLGVNGEEMTRKLNDGSMTIFEALRQVAEAIERSGGSSQAAGQVMQQVFGRQGAMAGSKLGEAIATLNTNLEETKTQTGEVGESMKELEAANERLDKAIRDTFEYDGWQTMANGIKTELVSALASVLELTLSIRDSTVGKIGHTIFDSIMSGVSKTLGPLGQLYDTLKGIVTLQGGSNNDSGIKPVIMNTDAEKAGKANLERLMANEIASRNKRPIVTTTTPRRRGGTTRTPKVETPLPVGSVASLNKELAELRKQQELATSTEKWDEYQAKIDSVTSRMKVLKGEIPDPSKIQQGKGTSVLGIGIGESALKDVQQQIDKLTGSEGGVKIPAKLDLKVGGGIGNIADTGKETADSWKSAASAIQSVGSAMQSIEDPSAKIAGIVAQAIATVAMAYAQALSTDWSSKSSIWTFIAAAAASTASMIGTIASIHSATGYAQGGIVDGRGGGFVPGTQTSGDNVNARLDAGELVLNRSQQSTLAGQLQGNPLGDLHLTTELKGTNILVSIERTLQSAGKGQLVTFK